MTQLTVKIRKVRPHAVLPTYGTAGAACFDLYAAETVVIKDRQTVVIPTGLAFEIPNGYEMQIRPRSGLSAKTKFRVILGTVDSDFRGEVGVIVDALADHRITNQARTLDGNIFEGAYGSYLVQRGDRIAQAAVVPIPRISFLETNEDLTQTERGVGGFGSTGVHYEDSYGDTQCRTCGAKVEGSYCNCHLPKGGR